MSVHCKDCKHYVDLVAIGISTADGALHLLGRFQCRSPQLRDHLEVNYFDGNRHQNSWVNAQACRDVSSLCGTAAVWFE